MQSHTGRGKLRQNSSVFKCLNDNSALDNATYAGGAFRVREAATQKELIIFFIHRQHGITKKDSIYYIQDSSSHN